MWIKKRTGRFLSTVRVVKPLILQEFNKNCELNYVNQLLTKNPHAFEVQNVNKRVDNVDNYFPRSVSPIFTTFPAPIVINKSPGEQLFNKKFSISVKEGK